MFPLDIQHVPERIERIGIGRIKLDGFLVFPNSPRMVAGVVEGVGERLVGAGVGRPKADGLPELLQSVGVPALFLEKAAQHQMGRGGIRAQGKGGLKLHNGICRLPLLAQGQREIITGVGTLGPQADGAAEFGQCVFVITTQLQDDPQRVVGVRRAWIKAHRIAQVGLGDGKLSAARCADTGLKLLC